MNSNKPVCCNTVMEGLKRDAEMIAWHVYKDAEETAPIADCRYWTDAVLAAIEWRNFQKGEAFADIDAMLAAAPRVVAAGAACEAVGDDMVERAKNACCKQWGKNVGYFAPETDEEWRAALIAAFTQPASSEKRWDELFDGSSAHDLASPPNQLAGTGAAPDATYHGREAGEDKECGMCGYVGKEDPVIGCPRCRWDEMREIPTSASVTYEQLKGIVDRAREWFGERDVLDAILREVQSHSFLASAPATSTETRDASPVGREWTLEDARWIVETAMCSENYGDPNAMLVALHATFPNGVSGGTER